MIKDFYFQKDDFTLINGDCFDVLKHLDEKTFDFIFADPPYFLSNNGISCQNGKQVSVNKGEWDKEIDILDKINFHKEWIRLCRRVLKDNGSIMISSTLHSVYAIGVALEMEGFSIINNIIWRKTNPAPNLACRCFTHSTETIIWARKVFQNGKKGKHYFDYKEMKKENYGKQMKDVWSFEVIEPEFIELSIASLKEKQFGRHPTQKPEKLLDRLIRCATKENDYILDPFSGSSTTGIIAKRLKRRFLGIEKEEEFLQLSKRRYEGEFNE